MKTSIIIPLSLLAVMGLFQNCSPGTVDILSSEANGMGYDGRPDLFPPIAFKTLNVMECNNDYDSEAARSIEAQVVYSPNENYIDEIHFLEISKKGFFSPRGKTAEEKLFKGNQLTIPMPFFGQPLVASEFDKVKRTLTMKLAATNSGLVERSYLLHCEEKTQTVK